MESNSANGKSLRTYRRTSITTRASRTSSTNGTLYVKGRKREMSQAKTCYKGDQSHSYKKETVLLFTLTEEFLGPKAECDDIRGKKFSLTS